MTKHSPKYVTARRRSPVRRNLVTYIARADLALGRVACIARCMRSNADRDRLRSPGGFVARSATFRRAAFARQMRRVFEFHVEPFLESFREWVKCRSGRVGGGVADAAHRLLLGIRELADVTAYASIVSGEFELEGCSFPPVARRAVKLLMFRKRVRKSLEILVGRSYRNRCRRLGRSYGYRNF